MCHLHDNQGRTNIAYFLYTHFVNTYKAYVVFWTTDRQSDNYRAPLVNVKEGGWLTLIVIPCLFGFNGMSSNMHFQTDTETD